jgi:hypothetical protein
MPPTRLVFVTTRSFFEEHWLLERLILYGALTTLDGGEPAGVALALHAPNRDAAVALLQDAQRGVDLLSEIETHEWEFGGRR